MSEITVELPKAEGTPRSFLGRVRESDLLASFLSSKITVVAGALTLIFFLAAILAPLIAPTNPFDPASNFLINSLTPPRFAAGGDVRFLLGTDDQGRDLWSAILYGLRVSLLIGLFGVLLGGAIGITLGLIAGYAGGRIDSIIMRIADVQLTFPAILIALLVDGVVQALLKGQNRDQTAFGILVVSIGLSFWVQYARTVRGSTLVEKNRDYVRRRASSACRRRASWFATSCRTSWGRCSSSRPSTSRSPSSPRRRSPSSASACRRPSLRSGP